MRGGSETDRRLARIAMYCRYFPPDVSGAGIQALALGKRLRALGHEVIVVADRSDGSPAVEHLDGICVYRIRGLAAGAGYLGLLGYWLRLFRALLALRRSFDILHAHGVTFETSFAAVIASLLRKPSLMKSTLAGEFRPPRGRASRSWLHHRFLRCVDLFIAISHELLDEYRANPALAARIELLPNGVDLTGYRPVDEHRRRELRAELELPDVPLLIYHGVFVERKSIDWLVEALGQLLAEGRFALLLVGSPGRDEPATGYYRDLMARTRKLRASKVVIVRDFQEDVARFLQACDAYVLPSTEEGLSNSLLEAMAVGLVPIASRASGTRELLKHQVNGLTFTPRNQAELRAAIAWYLSIRGSHAEASLRAAARAAVERKHSIDETARRYSALYRGLLSGRF